GRSQGRPAGQSGRRQQPERGQPQASGLVRQRHSGIQVEDIQAGQGNGYSQARKKAVPGQAAQQEPGQGHRNPRGVHPSQASHGQNGRGRPAGGRRQRTARRQPGAQDQSGQQGNRQARQPVRQRQAPGVT